MPALVVAADLADYPGAPFAESVVESAAESVRDEAGWHIAPAVTETLTLRSSGGTVLFLPSLHVTDVTAIRDADTGEAITGWSEDVNGLVHRSAGWWHGRKVEVDLTHGHDACPPALLPVIAERARAAKAGGRVMQESLGSRSVAYANAGTVADPALARYTIPPRP